MKFRVIAVLVTIAAITITMWLTLEPPRESWMLLAGAPAILLALGILVERRRRQSQLK